MAAEPNGHSKPLSRVELGDKLEIVRQEQKAEHWKTRLLVVLIALPSTLKSAPALLGFFHFHY